MRYLVVGINRFFGGSLGVIYARYCLKLREFRNKNCFHLPLNFFVPKAAQTCIVPRLLASTTSDSVVQVLLKHFRRADIQYLMICRSSMCSYLNCHFPLIHLIFVVLQSFLRLMIEYRRQQLDHGTQFHDTNPANEKKNGIQLVKLIFAQSNRFFKVP